MTTSDRGSKVGKGQRLSEAQYKIVKRAAWGLLHVQYEAWAPNVVRSYSREVDHLVTGIKGERRGAVRRDSVERLIREGLLTREGTGYHVWLTDAGRAAVAAYEGRETVEAKPVEAEPASEEQVAHGAEAGGVARRAEAKSALMVKPSQGPRVVSRAQCIARAEVEAERLDVVAPGCVDADRAREKAERLRRETERTTAELEAMRAETARLFSGEGDGRARWVSADGRTVIAFAMPDEWPYPEAQERDERYADLLAGAVTAKDAGRALTSKDYPGKTGRGEHGPGADMKRAVARSGQPLVKPWSAPKIPAGGKPLDGAALAALDAEGVCAEVEAAPGVWLPRAAVYVAETAAVNGWTVAMERDGSGGVIVRVAGVLAQKSGPVAGEMVAVWADGMYDVHRSDAYKDGQRLLQDTELARVLTTIGQRAEAGNIVTAEPAQGETPEADAEVESAPVASSDDAIGWHAGLDTDLMQRHPALVGPLRMSLEWQVAELEPGVERVIFLGQEFRLVSDGKGFEAFTASGGRMCGVLPRDRALSNIESSAFRSVPSEALRLVRLYEETRVHCVMCEPGFTWGRDESKKAVVEIAGAGEVFVCDGPFHLGLLKLVPEEYTEGLSVDAESAAMAQYAAWVGGQGERPPTLEERKAQKERGRGAKSSGKNTGPRVRDIVFTKGAKGQERAEILGHTYQVIVMAGAHSVDHVASGDRVCEYEKSRPAMKRAILADAVTRGEHRPEPVDESQQQREPLTYADLEGKTLDDFTTPEDLADLERLAAPWPVRWLFPPQKDDLPRAVNQFGGCGGWCVGIREILGYDVDMVCIDHNADAVATSKAAGCTALHADLTELDPDHPALRWTEYLISSPPCTDWTPAGKRLGHLPENLEILEEAINRAAWAAGNYEWGETGEADEDHPDWDPEFPPHYGPPSGQTWDEVRAITDAMTAPTAKLMLEPVIWALALWRQGAPLHTIALEQSGALPEDVQEALSSELYSAGWECVDWAEMDAADLGSPSHRRRRLMLASRYYNRRMPETPKLTTTGDAATGLAPDTVVTTRGNRKTSGGNKFVMGRVIPGVTSKIRSVDVGEKGGRFTIGQIAKLVTLPEDYPLTGSRTSQCQQAADIVAPVVSAAVMGTLLGVPWLPSLEDYLAKLYPAVHGADEDEYQGEEFTVSTVETPRPKERPFARPLQLDINGYRWGVECDRHGGAPVRIMGEYDSKEEAEGHARMHAYDHPEPVTPLTPEEIDEAAALAFSAKQLEVLSYADQGWLAEDVNGFFVSEQRESWKPKAFSAQRVITLYRAGFLKMLRRGDGQNREVRLSDTGQGACALWDRARRQGLVEPAESDNDFGMTAVEVRSYWSLKKEAAQAEEIPDAPAIRYTPNSVIVPDTAPEILKWAACHIENVGLYQGHSLLNGPGRTVTLACHPRGAVSVAAGNGRFASGRIYDHDAIRAAEHEALRLLAEHVTGVPVEMVTDPAEVRARYWRPVDEWGRADGRTAAEVADVMRAVASGATPAAGTAGIPAEEPAGVQVEEISSVGTDETLERSETPADRQGEPEPDITIRHTRADGTLIEGSAKGDGVWEAVRPWFRYSRGVGIYIRGSRDKAADQWKIDTAAGAIRKLGKTVAVVIDEDTRRSFAEAEAERVERAEGRSERYTDRAGRAAAASDDMWDRHDSIRERFFMGQPILVGHHSEKRARRDQERMWNLARRSISEQRRADYWAGRARAAESYEQHRNSPGRTLRRIDKLGAERRGILRQRDGDPRNPWWKAPSDERRAELDRLIAELDEELAHWRGIIAQAEADGFKVWGKADFVKGDFVRHRGTWYEVVRVNAKSVSVPHIHAYHQGGGAGTVGGQPVVTKESAAQTPMGKYTWTAPYDDVSGRMSAEQMRAALAGERIPAEEHTDAAEIQEQGSAGSGVEDSTPADVVSVDNPDPLCGEDGEPCNHAIRCGEERAAVTEAEVPCGHPSAWWVICGGNEAFMPEVPQTEQSEKQERNVVVHAIVENPAPQGAADSVPQEIPPTNNTGDETHVQAETEDMTMTAEPMVQTPVQDRRPRAKAAAAARRAAGLVRRIVPPAAARARAAGQKAVETVRSRRSRRRAPALVQPAMAVPQPVAPCPIEPEVQTPVKIVWCAAHLRRDGSQVQATEVLSLARRAWDMCDEHADRFATYLAGALDAPDADTAEIPAEEPVGVQVEETASVGADEIQDAGEEFEELDERQDDENDQEQDEPGAETPAEGFEPSVMVVGEIPGYSWEDARTAVRNAGYRVAGRADDTTVLIICGWNAENNATKLQDARERGIPCMDATVPSRFKDAVLKGEFVGGDPLPESAKAARVGITDQERNQQIREWARTVGYMVPARGRIKAEIRNAYERAHQDDTAHRGLTGAAA